MIRRQEFTLSHALLICVQEDVCLKLSIVAGSSRAASQSSRIARYLEGRIAALFPAVETYLHDLAEQPIPPWDETIWSGAPGPLNDAWGPVSRELEASDGLIVVTPEWHGMVPPQLKNLLLLCTGELANKPGLIVSVSASAGGTYPVTELRSSGCKNNRICWIPDHVIIRRVKEALPETGDNGNQADDETAARCEHSLGILIEYAKALRSVRDSGVCDLKRFPFGM